MIDEQTHDELASLVNMIEVCHQVAGAEDRRHAQAVAETRQAEARQLAGIERILPQLHRYGARYQFITEQGRLATIRRVPNPGPSPIEVTIEQLPRLELTT